MSRHTMVLQISPKDLPGPQQDNSHHIEKSLQTEGPSDDTSDDTVETKDDCSPKQLRRSRLRSESRCQDRSLDRHREKSKRYELRTRSPSPSLFLPLRGICLDYTITLWSPLLLSLSSSCSPPVEEERTGHYVLK